MSAAAEGAGFALCWGLLTAESEGALLAVLHQLIAVAESGGISADDHKGIFVEVVRKVKDDKAEIWTRAVATQFGIFLKALA